MEVKFDKRPTEPINGFKKAKECRLSGTETTQTL
jgi:hypothetical protein